MLSNRSTYVIAHAILKGKTEIIYKELFDEINVMTQKLLGKKLFMKGTSVLVDFELAVIKCLTEYGVNIHGCLFHWRQCLIRKIGELGFKKEYVNNPSVRIIIHRFMNLCYLKRRDIRGTFLEFKDLFLGSLDGFEDGLKEKLKAFVLYFENVWIDKWPIDLWCCCMQSVRTDNDSEAYHSALKKRLNFQKPSMSQLLLHLDKIEKYEIIRLKRLDKGLSNKRVRIRKGDYSTRIIHLTNNLYNKSITKESFFLSLDELLVKKNELNFVQDEQNFGDGHFEGEFDFSKIIKTRSESKKKFVSDLIKNGKILQNFYKKTILSKIQKPRKRITPPKMVKRKQK